MVAGIYGIKNTVTGKYYIGCAKDIKKRWREHKYHLKRGDHHSVKLQRSYDKHGGIKSFEFVVLREVDDLNTLYEVESEFIRLYQSWNNGYNVKSDSSTHISGCSNAVRLVRSVKKKEQLTEWSYPKIDPSNVHLYIKEYIETCYNGSQQALARDSGCSEAYISQVLTGRRTPGKKILDAVGLEKIVDYRVKE